jgi:cytoskeletal protein RodZ
VRTFGETLRQARLDKGVSLADAERDTRIRRHYLEALEAEDTGSLPSPVYSRGFVRTYAEYLGLNGSAMVEMFQPNPKRQPPPPPLRHALPHVAIPREVPVRPVLYALGAIVLIALAVLVVVKYLEFAAEVRKTEDPLPKPTVTISSRGPTPNPLTVASPSPTAPAVVPTATVEPTATPEPTATREPTAVVDGILVEFRTTARVYVEAAVDNQQVLAETLEAGTQKSLPVAKSVVVMRVSNASAVDVTVNGKHQDPASGTTPVEYTWRR